MPERSHPQIQLSKAEIEQLVSPALPHIGHVLLVEGGTGGGNTHYQIEAEGGPYILRLYVRYPKAVIKEQQIHEQLKHQDFIPQLLYANESPPLALFRKHPGKRLSEVPWPNNLSFTLGGTLAGIHSITFPWSGLCTNGLVPDGSFDKETSPYYRETLRLLTQEKRVAKRLGPDLTRQTFRWMEAEQASFPKLGAQSHLVHSDFRPENLLYNAKEGLCVLDWEFAHVGNPLIDFGILLRHAHCFPLDTAQLKAGYESGGGTMPPDWEKTAALGDLVNILEVLSRPVALPKIFAFLTDALSRRLLKWHCQA